MALPPKPQGPAVFSSRALPSAAVSRLLDLGRSVLGPKYTGEALREALQTDTGDRRLEQSRPHDRAEADPQRLAAFHA